MILENIEMVVFDMAGTTIDEDNVVYKTIHKAIKKYNFDIPLEVVLEIGAGKEKLQAIKDIIRKVEPTKLNLASIIFKNFKVLLDEAYEVADVKPIAGVETLLLELKQQGIKVVLNTGYNKKVATHLLEKLQWNLKVHYDMLITADDVENGRPHPDMILMAMSHFNINDPSKVLKAGDSATDIEEGKNANCGVTVGVLSGAQNKEQLEAAKPSYILESLSNILSI